MAHVCDSDTALWLHNKLGSAEELWIPSSISAIIKTTTIDNIYRCFPVLTTTVKLKLLLGVLHLPRRNMEEMKHTIEGVIELAVEDSDLWVKLVASIIKTYPMTFNLNLDLTSSPIAQHVLQQAAEKVKSADTFSSLPLECQFLNKSALQNLVGTLPPQKRHFALLKRPKSAALRTELLQKSDDAVSQLKKGGAGMGSKTVPVKHRDMTRRSSDIGPMKRIPTKASMSRPETARSISSSNTPTANRSLARTSRQQAGGTKLLDISEQPIGGSGIGVRDSKRRKKMLQQQDAAMASQPQEEEEVEPDKSSEQAPPGIISSALAPVPPEIADFEYSSPEKPQSATARRSTTGSTEQESSSEDEEDEDETPNVVEEPVSASQTVYLPPSPVLPKSPPTSNTNGKLLSPPITPSANANIRLLSSPNNLPPPAQSNSPIVRAAASPVRPPASQVVQPNKTIYRLTSPPQVSANEPASAPFREVQAAIRQRLPVRQLTPSRSQQASSAAPSMPSPIVVRKITPQPTPLSASASISGSVPVIQQRIQNPSSMYVPNRLVFNQPQQSMPVVQNLSQPRAIVIRQQEPQPTQQHQIQLQQAQQRQIQQLRAQRHLQPASNTGTVAQQSRLVRQQVPISNPNFFQARQMLQRLPVASQPQPQPQPQQQQANFAKPPANNPPPKHGLMLTRDQMYEAQELFRLAPNLTRPEKAIILGFIAGNRENPYPDQGDIIRFTLSESLQHVQNSHGGGIFPVIVEVVLELNYSTGKLSKVSRLKPTSQPLPQAVLKT